MMTVPDFDALVAIYEDYAQSVNDTLTARFQKKVERIASEHHQQVEAGGESMTATEIEAIAAVAVTNEVLAYNREQARSIGQNFKHEKLTAEQAVSRINTVLGEMTGLRKVLLKMNDGAPLGNILHARLDERVLVNQEFIATDIKRAVESRGTKDVVFEENSPLVLT